MANEENLIPFNERTESEQTDRPEGRHCFRCGPPPQAQHERSRRLLSQPAETDRRRVNALLRDEVDNEDIDNQMSVVMALHRSRQAR